MEDITENVCENRREFLFRVGRITSAILLNIHRKVDEGRSRCVMNNARTAPGKHAIADPRGTVEYRRGEIC